MEEILAFNGGMTTRPATSTLTDTNSTIEAAMTTAAGHTVLHYG